MKHVTLGALALAGAALVTGCADGPLQPELAPQALAVTSSSLDLADFDVAVPAKHLVVFKARAPRDFAEQVAVLGGRLTLNHDLGIAVVVGLDGAASLELKRLTGAQYVEPMATMRLIEPAAVAEPTYEALDLADSFGAGVSSASNPAGAILFARQWNMRQVHADAAWAGGRLGSADVTVAILDTGIDYMLPDLVGRVDLDRSASFEERDDTLAQLYFPGRHLSTDLHYHGTNVATQVASNAWAFAGVTSGTTLMSVKVCSVLGGCRGVIEGLAYAIDNGADVINMSLGGWFSKAAYPGAVSAYNRLMNYAAQRGVTIVVAAGNDANDLDRHGNIAIRDKDGNIVDRVHVPSFFSMYCDATHVICVAATRMNDIPAAYTNYGRSAIDVAAPGGGGGDWVYSLCPRTSLLFNCAGGYYPLGVAGTSQATPHVAGLAALAVEDVGRNPADVRAYIRDSADPIGGGNTAFYGKGRINVARAIGLD